VRVLVAQHHRDGQELALRARTFGTPDGQRLLGTAEEFVEALGRLRIPTADLGADGVQALWERAGTQHAAWRALQARAASAAADGAGSR
jgi:N-hydroxyarylamine O-acetyltransferase